MLIVNEYHLRQVLTEYLQHYNTARPHRALSQLTPAQADTRPPAGQPRRAPDPRGCARGRVRSRRGSGRRDMAAAGSAAGPRARRRGGSTRWPAWSRSRSARSPLPGTTGSPRSGSGSGGLARQTWPGCAPRGTRSLAGTGRRMRKRSGWCWTAWTREPRPGPCSGRARAIAGARAGRPRPACAATVRGASSTKARGLLRLLSAGSGQFLRCSSKNAMMRRRASCADGSW